MVVLRNRWDLIVGKMSGINEDAGRLKRGLLACQANFGTMRARIPHLLHVPAFLDPSQVGR